MNENYVRGAQKRKEAREQVSASVDDFFAKKKEKEENYVPKEIKFRRLGIGLYQLYFEGGGEIPASLSGLYTSIFAAEQAIEKYKQTCRAK